MKSRKRKRLFGRSVLVIFIVGVIIFILFVLFLLFGGLFLVKPRYQPEEEFKSKIPPATSELWRKNKDKNICGPDITDELYATVKKIQSTFHGWTPAQQRTACFSLVDPSTAAAAWDIDKLSPSGKNWIKKYQPYCGMPQKSICEQSVEVDNKCFYGGSVNYISYGTMYRLCYDNLGMDGYLFNRYTMRASIALYKRWTNASNEKASSEWAAVGYDGWRPGSRLTPPWEQDVVQCRQFCPYDYSSSGTPPFKVHWDSFPLF